MTTDTGRTGAPWQQGEKLGGHPLEIWSASGKHVAQVTKSPFGPYPDGPEAFHNAAFIVRAVNSHDDLVKAVKRLLACHYGRENLDDTEKADAAKEARAALISAGYTESPDVK